MSWINKNWKALTVVGGILGVSAYASKYFDVEPVDDLEAETFNAKESFSSKLARYGDGKRVINKKNKEKGVLKVTERPVIYGGINMGIGTSYEVYYDKGTHFYTDNFTTLMRKFTPIDDEKNAETFDAETKGKYLPYKKSNSRFVDEKHENMNERLVDLGFGRTNYFPDEGKSWSLPFDLPVHHDFYEDENGENRSVLAQVSPHDAALIISNIKPADRNKIIAIILGYNDNEDEGKIMLDYPDVEITDEIVGLESDVVSMLLQVGKITDFRGNTLDEEELYRFGAEDFGAEGFELIMIDSEGKRKVVGEYDTYEDAEIDLEESYPRKDYEMMDFEIIAKRNNLASRKHKFGAETQTFEARYKNDGTIAFTEKEWYGGYSRTGPNHWGAIPLGKIENERYFYIDGLIVMVSPEVRPLKNEYNVKVIMDLLNSYNADFYNSFATPTQKQRARQLISKVFKEYDRQTKFRRGAEDFGAETDYDDYIDRIFTFIDEKVGTEYFPSDEDEEEVARFKKDFNDEFDEVGQAIEDANDWSWNEILGAEEDDEAYIRDRYGESLENMSISRKLESVASSLKDLTSEDMLFTVINNLSTKQANQLINRLYAGIREGSIRRKPFRHNMRMGAEEKRYPRSPNDEILDGFSEMDLRKIIYLYGAEIRSMKDREKYLERILKNEGVWYSNPTIDDYMNEGMTKSEATSAYNINRTDELFATILYLLEYANKGGLKVKSFEADTADVDFDEAYMEKQDAERIMKLLKIVRRKATGSNARYAKNYAREAENAYYQYGMKGLKVQVAYVLSNLGGWRGDEAKEVKAELRKLTK